MRRLAAACVALTCTGFPAAARADLFSSVSYGAQVSTIGAGITVEKPLLYNFSARITTGNGSYTSSLDLGGKSYTQTNKFGNVAVIADFRPSNGRYRLSGGVIVGSDRIDGVAESATPTSIHVGNGYYSTAQTGAISTRVAFDHPSLYAGVGTGAGLIKGLALTVDAGAILRNGTASTSASGPLASDPGFQADLGRLRGQLRTRIVMPFVSVGVVFRP
jgi:hypothetical protein